MSFLCSLPPSLCNSNGGICDANFVKICEIIKFLCFFLYRFGRLIFIAYLYRKIGAVYCYLYVAFASRMEMNVKLNSEDYGKQERA